MDINRRDRVVRILRFNKRFSEIRNAEGQGSRSFGYVMKYSLYALLMTMFVSLTTGKLSAQNYEHLEKLVRETEETRFPESSDNGKWLAWYSVLGDGSKNLKLQSILNQNLLLERKNINLMRFVGNHLAIQSGEMLEYLDPETGKSRSFKNVSKFLYDDKNNALIVLYTEKEGRKLEVFDTDLNLRQTIADVQYVYAKNDQTVVRRKMGDLNEVLVLKKGLFENVFSTTEDLKNVVPSGTKENGLVVHSLNDGTSKIYYIAPDKKRFVLDISQYNDYDQMTLSPSRSDHHIVIKLEKKVRAKKEMVDVWYGTDFDLAAHNTSILKAIQIDWNPFTAKTNMLTRSSYFGETTIGNDLYLMNQVDKNQVDKMDKAGGQGFDKLFLWNAAVDEYTFISDVQKEMVISPTGDYLLIQKENNWQLYNTIKLQIVDLDVSREMMPYFTSDNDVLWVGGNTIAEQNLFNRKVREVFKGENSMIELIDFKRVYTDVGNKRDFRTADLKKPLVIKITDVRDQNVSYAYLKNRKLHSILSSTPDQITEFKQLGQNESYYWIAENYNKRPMLMVKKAKENPKVLYVSDQNDQKFEKTEMIRISYKGSDGENISGALFMPLNFDRSKKYPVVVHIYEKQDYLTKRFLRPSFANPTGYNIALLMEEGFAVLLADISQSDKGAGISALESINNALIELQKIKYVDMNRIGLMGQSFGGYETNFIATHSDRFAAYVSGAAVSDVIRTYYAYNYNFNAPDYYRYEGRQYWFKSTVAEDPEKYIRNNPIMYAQNVTAPMLLWTGTDDGNVSPEGTKSMFIALRKYKKPVIALFYDKEGHAMKKQETQRDLTVKILDWFNYHLKDYKDIFWIHKYIKGA